MTVHHVGNRSEMDRTGRLLRFRVQTMCGRKLATPQLVTDSRRATTCRNCQRVMDLAWGPRKVRR